MNQIHEVSNLLDHHQFPWQWMLGAQDAKDLASHQQWQLCRGRTKVDALLGGRHLAQRRRRLWCSRLRRPHIAQISKGVVERGLLERLGRVAACTEHT